MNFKKSFKFAAPLAFISASSLLIGTSAYARHHHMSMQADGPTPTASCVFPDGTSPKRPEVHCYGPTEFLKAYGIDQLHAAGITGKGQVIILADSFGSPTAQQDLDHFSDTYGIARTTVQFIYPNGPYVNDLADDDKVGWAGETTLDLEWAHAIAPDATIVNIITNVSETVGLAGLPDLFKGVQMATAQYPGAIISMSFGTGEPTFTPSDIKDYLQGSFHDILKKAAAADITVLASTGDSGTTNEDAAMANMVPYPNASYPASDPLITAVGGTALEIGWKWTPQGTADDFWTCKLFPNSSCAKDFMAAEVSTNNLETVWKEDWAFAAGGGGVSTIFNAARYQQNLNEDAQIIMKGHRALPDVSMNAAINGGVNIYTSYVAPKLGAMGPTWQNTGGTSCASPEMAALVALAGQTASDTLGKKVGIGFLNPILYSLPDSDFNDITSASLGDKSQVSIDNDSIYYSADTFKKFPKNAPPVPVPGYYTTPGYDMATGLGTPKAERLVLDIARARIARESHFKRK